jgi:hypothetical protein
MHDMGDISWFVGITGNEAADVGANVQLANKEGRLPGSVSIDKGVIPVTHVTLKDGVAMEGGTAADTEAVALPPWVSRHTALILQTVPLTA